MHFTQKGRNVIALPSFTIPCLHSAKKRNLLYSFAITLFFIRTRLPKTEKEMKAMIILNLLVKAFIVESTRENTNREITHSLWLRQFQAR